MFNYLRNANIKRRLAGLVTVFAVALLAVGAVALGSATLILRNISTVVDEAVPEVRLADDASKTFDAMALLLHRYLNSSDSALVARFTELDGHRLQQFDASTKAGAQTAADLETIKALNAGFQRFSDAFIKELVPNEQQRQLPHGAYPACRIR